MLILYKHIPQIYVYILQTFTWKIFRLSYDLGG